MKKNGRAKFLLAFFCVSGITLLALNKQKGKSFIQNNSLTIDNFVNRLKEFDLSPSKDAYNLFYDLIEFGFSPQSAFDVAQKEATDAGEYFQ